jgi:hypothetical protein
MYSQGPCSVHSLYMDKLLYSGLFMVHLTKLIPMLSDRMSNEEWIGMDMKGSGCSELSSGLYCRVRQYNPEDSSEHHTRRRENLKPHKGSGCCLIYKTILASDCRDCGANAQIQDINFFPENLICNTAPNLLETQLTNNFITKVQHKTYMLIIQERLVSRQKLHVRKSVRATSLALK